MREINWTKYIFVLIITGVIFISVVSLSGYFSGKKMEELNNIEDKISMNILASETQFLLLGESSCKNIDNSVLSRELNSLAAKLDYSEKNLGVDNAEVKRLKKYYSLLEIKDYLLLKKMGEKCDFSPVFILYFYSNKGDCPDCQSAGYALTYLRREYPRLRIYSFDYNLDLSTIKTLIAMYGVKNDLPAIVINGEVYYGLKAQDEIKELFPDVKQGEEAMAKSSVIVLAPHFDDAVLSIGGLMSGQKSLSVATFFSGRPDTVMSTEWNKLSGFRDSDQAVSSRTEENRRVLASYDAGVRNYGYLDSQYRIDSKGAGLKEKIIKDIEKIIKDNNSPHLSLYGPAIFGSDLVHPDHKILHEAFISVAEKNKDSRVKFFMYEDFPYIYKFIKNTKGNFYNYLKGKQDIKIKKIEIPLTSQQLENKVDEIEKYTSQVKAFRALGNNLAENAKDFFQNRCAKDVEFKNKPCEVVYRISN